MIVIIYEGDSTRQIYTDGRALPAEIVQPAWLGYSVGHWERDTLVVESAGFNDKTSLDLIGHPIAKACASWNATMAETTFADSDIFQNVCNENEKDSAHLAPK